MHEKSRIASTALAPGTETVCRGRRFLAPLLAATPLPLLRAVAPACLIGATVLAACSGGPTEADPVCGESPALVPGVETVGDLGPGDAMRDDAPVDYYTLQLGRGATLVVRMATPRFTPFIYLLDADARLLAQAYDPERGHSTDLSVSVDAGCYIVGAGAWDPGSAGNYTLSVHLQ